MRELHCNLQILSENEVYVKLKEDVCYIKTCVMKHVLVLFIKLYYFITLLNNNKCRKMFVGYGKVGCQKNIRG